MAVMIPRQEAAWTALEGCWTMAAMFLRVVHRATALRARPSAVLAELDRAAPYHLPGHGQSIPGGRAAAARWLPTSPRRRWRRSREAEQPRKVAIASERQMTAPWSRLGQAMPLLRRAARRLKWPAELAQPSEIWAACHSQPGDAAAPGRAIAIQAAAKR